MFASVRAGLFAALVTLVSVAMCPMPASAAEKAFQRDDLADAAIKLEAQIKTDAGQVDQAAARSCGARPTRRSSATISAPACCCSARSSRSRPSDSANWLRLARTVLQIRPATTASARRCSSAPATAAYIAYQRTKNRGEEADSLLIIVAQLRRPPALAAGARCAAALARAARGRRRARALRAHARGSRLPPARLLGRCRCRVAARLLPVLRRPAGQAHRLLAVRRGRRPGQARRCRPRTSSSASKASSTASATPSRCAPACRRPCARRWRSRPSSPSMCATASRSCASPARPMCCRAPASAASRWSASTPRRWRSRSTASATAT